MAQLTITIPPAITQRVINGFALTNNYQELLPDPNGPLGSTIVNPETKVAFCKRKLLEYIKESVRTAEIKVASKTAMINASVSVDTDIILS